MGVHRNEHDPFLWVSRRTLRGQGEERRWRLIRWGQHVHLFRILTTLSILYTMNINTMNIYILYICIYTQRQTSTWREMKGQPDVSATIRPYTIVVDPGATFSRRLVTRCPPALPRWTMTEEADVAAFTPSKWVERCLTLTTPFHAEVRALLCSTVQGAPCSLRLPGFFRIRGPKSFDQSGLDVSIL